jgi:hypothetical protein
MIRQTAALWSAVQLPPSNWRCPARRSEASRRPSMTLERSASERIPSGQVTLDWTFRYPRLLWKWLHRSEMAGPARDSLIRVNISLIGRFNSLLDRIKFPVRIRRELPSKALILFPEFKPLAGLGGLPRTKFLVYSQLAGNLGSETSSLKTASSSGESGANRNWSAEAGPGAILHRGTEGSNPPPSSGESVSALNPSAGGEESRGFAAVCSCMGT